MPKCVVADPMFDWDADEALNHPWEETVIYEAHVKGLTKLHPDVLEPDRGTFAGLARDAVIAHLHRIGVTAIEIGFRGLMHKRRARCCSRSVRRGGRLLSSRVLRDCGEYDGLLAASASRHATVD